MNTSGQGIPIYRMNEIHNCLCDSNINKFADIDAKTLNDFILNDRDVLFNRTNSYEYVGRTGIYYSNINSIRTFASYLVRFVADEQYVKNEYLACFLNTKQAKKEIRRRARQSINQTNVNPEEVKEIEIPLLSDYFQKEIVNLFQESNKLRIQAEHFYNQAEDILNRELGITNIENTKNYSVKSFSESFCESNRLDAEYYQDKYDSIKELLDTKENVESLCHIYDNNYIPTNKRNYQYIELSNVGMNGEISGVDVFNGKELPTRARRLVKKNQVIISSVEGSLQSCALITEEYDGALCSNGFFIIDSDCISSETLLILFKSLPIQALLKQRCSGTILTAISNDELKKIPLPFIKQTLQKEITQKVQESFKLRKDSKKLITVAIRAVELAIEKNEEYASQWLIENTNEIYHKAKY